MGGQSWLGQAVVTWARGREAASAGLSQVGSGGGWSRLGWAWLGRAVSAWLGHLSSFGGGDLGLPGLDSTV